MTIATARAIVLGLVVAGCTGEERRRDAGEIEDAALSDADRRLDDAGGAGMLDSGQLILRCDTSTAARDPLSRVAIQWARLASDGPDLRLFGRVDVANLAPTKDVRIVYRTDGGGWSECAAWWHSMISEDRERWYFEIPDRIDGARMELFATFTSEAGEFSDGTEAAPHCVDSTGPLLVDQEVLLTRVERTDDAIEGSVSTRGAGAVGVLATDDDWATEHEVAAIREASSVHHFRIEGLDPDATIELAAYTTLPSGRAWDNGFGDNHRFFPALADLHGRWDLSADATPSWLEIRGIAGMAPIRFVGAVGSVRPSWGLDPNDDAFDLTIPPQYEPAPLRLSLARTDANVLDGTFDDGGGPRPVSAIRAPALERRVSFGPATDLFDGASLAGWTPEPGRASAWTVEGGVLSNAAPGANLVSDERFDDFQLELDVRLPVGGNSGVFLRGRYEVQLLDQPGRPSPLRHGALYGFITPSRAPSSIDVTEWHHLEIALVGRRVSISIDGEPWIVERIIPGLTGGARDAHEGAPGPIVFQGDHTAVELRNVRIARGR